MTKLNTHYGELEESYLFAGIARKVSAYAQAHPDQALKATENALWMTEGGTYWLDPGQSATGGEGTGTAYAGASKAHVSLWWLLIPAVPILWVGTGLLIRKRREARFRDPNVRRSIPHMALYLKRLERLKVPKDPDARDWAVEATFSNHAMKEEHRELLKRVHKAQRDVYRDKPVLRFLLRWIVYFI